MGMPVVRAKDIMKKKLNFVDGMATVKEAVEIMRKEGVNALLVEKRTPEDAWAIVSVKDVVRGPLIEGRDFDDVNVYEVMTKPVLAVNADMDVRYVARLLDKIGVNRAPVEMNGELVGMISLSGIVLRDTAEG